MPDMNASEKTPTVLVRSILLMLALMPISYAAARAYSHFQGLPLPCPFRLITGLPCALCFGTKSWIFILQGRVLRALAVNPLGAFLFVTDAAAATWLVFAMALRLPALPIERLTSRTAVWVAMLAALAANWIYEIVRVTLL